MQNKNVFDGLRRANPARESMRAPEDVPPGAVFQETSADMNATAFSPIYASGAPLSRRSTSTLAAQVSDLAFQQAASFSVDATNDSCNTPSRTITAYQQHSEATGLPTTAPHTPLRNQNNNSRGVYSSTTSMSEKRWQRSQNSLCSTPTPKGLLKKKHNAASAAAAKLSSGLQHRHMDVNAITAASPETKQNQESYAPIFSLPIVLPNYSQSSHSTGDSRILFQNSRGDDDADVSDLEGRGLHTDHSNTTDATERVIIKNPFSSSATDTDDSSVCWGDEFDIKKGEDCRGLVGLSHSGGGLGDELDCYVNAHDDDNLLSTSLSDNAPFDSDDDEDGGQRAHCRISSVLAVAILMCVGVVVVGLLGFLPFYLISFKANTSTTEFLLTETMKGVSSITQNSVAMLPAFVQIITFNYIKRQSTTQSEVNLPDDPAKLMSSLLAVLTRFRPSIQFLRFVYTGGLYTSADYHDNFSHAYGAYNTEAAVSIEYQAHSNGTLVEPPVEGGEIDFRDELTRSNGPLRRIVNEWAANHSNNDRWLRDSVNVTSIYFTYVLPFSVDTTLGYCEAGLPPGNVIQETKKLIPALRKHGHLVVLDSERGIVLENTWGQDSISSMTGPDGSEMYKSLSIEDVDDPFMMAGIREVQYRGGFDKVLGSQNSSVVEFRYDNGHAYLQLTRVTDNYGLNIIFGVTVLTSDFESAFRTARYVVIAVTVSVVVIAAGIAILIACQVVKPLKKLVPELQRASQLEITPDSDSDLKGGKAKKRGPRYMITEIYDIQSAYKQLKDSLLEMKSFVPQAVMTNAEDSAMHEGLDEYNLATLVSGNSGAPPRRDMRLNTKIFKDHINQFKKRTYTLVIIELHARVDVMSHCVIADIITENVSLYCGCVEQLGHNHLLISFGAHSPLPMHALKGCNFALDVMNRLPESMRKYFVLLVDSNEFMVGTCGANKRNSRVVFGTSHMLEITRILWDIDCHVAATPTTTSHLPENQSIPIECVQLHGCKVPFVLCELLPGPGERVQQVNTDANLCRAAFFHMRSGAYEAAITCFNGVQDKSNRQVRRLLSLSQQRYATGDKSPYVYFTEDIYNFEQEAQLDSSQARRDVNDKKRDMALSELTFEAQTCLTKAHEATPIPEPVFEATPTKMVDPVKLDPNWHSDYETQEPLQRRPTTVSYPPQEQHIGDLPQPTIKYATLSQLSALRRPDMAQRNSAGGSAEDVTPMPIAAFVAEQAQSYSRSGEGKHIHDDMYWGNSVDNGSCANGPLIDMILPGASSSEDEDLDQLNAASTAVNTTAVSTIDPDVPISFKDLDGCQWSRSKKRISEGAFSVVYLGMSDDGVQVAIKCIGRRRRDIERPKIEAEMHMASALKHPNIVRYISCSMTSTHFAIIMEYVPGGSLYAVIEKFGALNPTVVRRFMIDILNCLAYLHISGIVHCDVKPHNMLLGMDGVCKLSDFGSTMFETPDLDGSSVNEIVLRGTALYMAPEVARGERCTPQSDVFSLGISLLHMILGRLPWKWSPAMSAKRDESALRLMFSNDVRFVQSLSRGEIVPDIPDSLNAEVYSFAKACCDDDPFRRPSAQELLSSYPFLV